MKKIKVDVNPSYNVIAGENILQDIGKISLELCKGKKVAIITDTNVFKLCTNIIMDSFARAGFEVHGCVFKFEAGEEQKTFETIGNIVNFLAKKKLTRADTVIALGGGVVGDMAGFASAIYLRGINFIQVPTTLLAMVDSSVGGKTGCDLPAGKNLVGAFHQPKLVVADVNTLKTLPQKYKADGFAEVIKHAAIADLSMFKALENNEYDNNLVDLVARNVGIKASVVAKDEFDTGLRQALNFGHTIGHALEKFYNFKNISHGEAVAFGMIVETKAAERANLCEVGTAQRLQALLEKYGLKTNFDVKISDLIDAMLVDKKTSGDNITLALVSKIGTHNLHTIKTADLSRFFGGNQ